MMIHGLIPQAKLSDADKIKAHNLWHEISGYKSIRNRIAHNPISGSIRAATGERVFTVLDVNQLNLTGVMVYKELSLSTIHDTAMRVAQLNLELAAMAAQVFFCKMF
jgi:hypothetical protein